MIGVPAYLKLDETDNLLNPTRGYRAQLSVMPARTVSGPPLTFVSNLVAGSTYWGVGSEQRAILAGKLAVASLDGAPLAPLPADQRIYAGGGGSIRPYAYQLAGPIDIGNSPSGVDRAWCSISKRGSRSLKTSVSYPLWMLAAITRARHHSQAAPCSTA